MDNPDILLVGAAKLLSAKLMSLAIGVIGFALSLNVWFLSRMVTSIDQMQVSIQEQKIIVAVTNTKLEQIDQRQDRLAKYVTDKFERLSIGKP